MLDSINSQKGVLDLLNKYSNIISRVDAEYLLSYILKCTRGELYLNEGSGYFPTPHPEDPERSEGDEGSHNILRPFGLQDEKLYDSFVQRRLSGEPLQYITGTAEFAGLDFVVNKDVFIPRPETELLINEVVSGTGNWKILDLCTGCGNLAISLARLMPQAEIVATDISEPALKVAQKNAILHKVAQNITFYKGDLFKALHREVRFDIILCNPPYIKSSDLEFLQKEVQCEPKIALDGGDDGLDFYRQIAAQAPNYLKRDGVLLLEIGFGQAKLVKNIFSSTNKFEICKLIEDFAGIERVVVISTQITTNKNRITTN